MRLLKRFVQGQLRLTRIEVFSNGVFAIVVTLLVLELKVSELAYQLLHCLQLLVKPSPHSRSNPPRGLWDGMVELNFPDVPVVHSFSDRLDG